MRDVDARSRKQPRLMFDFLPTPLTHLVATDQYHHVRNFCLSCRRRRAADRRSPQVSGGAIGAHRPPRTRLNNRRPAGRPSLLLLPSVCTRWTLLRCGVPPLCPDYFTHSRARAPLPPRLAINGLDTASGQPMCLEAYPHLTLMCNGEIYNHEELAAEHGIKVSSTTTLLRVLWRLTRRDRGWLCAVCVVIRRVRQHRSDDLACPWPSSLSPGRTVRSFFTSLRCGRATSAAWRSHWTASLAL